MLPVAESNSQGSRVPGLAVLLAFVVVAGLVAGVVIGVAVIDSSSSDTAAEDGGGGGGGTGDTSGGAGSAGEEVYSGTCASCHGANLEGGVGLPLDGSQFVIDSTEEELVAFVNQGRAASDPDNQTGNDMPAKGGNPSLTDEDIAAVVTYIKSVNEG